MTQISKNHGLRVPQIDLAAILADPNPRIDLRVQACETSTRNFLKAVGNYKTRTIATITDRRAAHAAEKKRLLEKIVNVETETNECKMKEIQLVSDLQREQEERKEAELGVAAFKRQLATLRDKCTAIDSQIEHYRATAGNLERDKGKERGHLTSMSARIASEADGTQKRLACVVDGVDIDQLLIRMWNIDPSDPAREFKLVLDTSGSSYKVLTCSPSLSNLPFLLAHLNLNEPNDLPAFIQDVRQAYADMFMDAT